MRCIKHQKTELEIATTVEKKFVPWQTEPVKIHLDVEYCPECFKNHEKGEPMFHNLELTNEIGKNEDLNDKISRYTEHSK
jgi:hypothetical protein|tara:strand:- start:8401 stop:8640 length:240 start_codon:yes stop_codon:yes gene_type:complete